MCAKTMTIFLQIYNKYDGDPRKRWLPDIEETKS